MVLKLSRFNNIYELNFSKEDVSEFKKRQANVVNIKMHQNWFYKFFLRK